MSVGEITTYGVPGACGRASSFDTQDCSVLVTPTAAVDGERGTSAAKALAEDLLKASVLHLELIDLKRKLGESEAALVRAQAEIDRLSSYRPPARLLGPGFVRFEEDGKIWVLNKRERGFGHFGYRLDSWDELFRRFDARVTSHGTDEHGPWWQIESRGAA